MDRGEPTLAPQWLKAAGTSSHSDEHNSGSLSRNRLTASISAHDTPRAASSAAFRRSTSSNGSMCHDKDNYAQSRVYSSFGRSHRDRDRDRDRQRDREKNNLLDNGYSVYGDLLSPRRTEKETLRRCQSMVTGRRIESVTKRAGSDLSNDTTLLGSPSSGLNKVSFEKEFPTLGAEERQGVSDVARIPSPGISPAINSLLISAPAIIGADGWTSALAEVPSVGLGNGPPTPGAVQTVANVSSLVCATSTGLSMAETVAQAPLRARSAPQVSSENDRRKEQTLVQQYNKLIPVINSSEKSKTKGVRNSDVISSKGVQQLPSQLVSRLPITKQPDTSKPPQTGNFQVLNQKKNEGSPTAKDKPTVITANRVAAQLAGGAGSSASSPHPKSPLNPKPKANGMGAGKHDFFNSIRRQSVMKNIASSSSSVSSPSNPEEKPDEKVMEGDSSASDCQGNIITATSSPGSMCTVVEKVVNGSVCDEDEPEAMVAPNEEEKRFLYELGWNENAGESALTDEEILSFVQKHEEKLGPDFKLKAGLPGPRQNGGNGVSNGSSALGSEGHDKMADIDFPLDQSEARS